MNDTGGRRLWIGNLDERITEFTLLKLLQRYGKIEQFDFLFHKSGPNQGKPRGYCFASFENRTDAVHALHALDGKLALGKKLAVKWAHSHIKAPNEPVPLEKPEINLHPDKIPSSFGGQSTKVPEEPTAKKKPVNSSVESQIRAIEGKLREMDRSTSKATFKPVPVYATKKPEQPKEIIQKCLPSLMSLPLEPPPSTSSVSTAVTSSETSSSTLDSNSSKTEQVETKSSSSSQSLSSPSSEPSSTTSSKTTSNVSSAAVKSQVTNTGKSKASGRPKPYDKR
ncbi:probable RNA-binding protein 18 [Strongylocentrotus purpuratus]|uniref:Probable RNA-binding protein 18 n=1 Tax=Strongylocentrotus purpuratus TaxID=7668 RepID=A0A7M7NMU5_STRPU|nr:probable RNA-binding protein 18 [Strongylocentrotus purpuratus]